MAEALGGEPSLAVSRRRAVVVGAGLAGLEAARVLHERDFDVTVVETRARVGGRVFSFEDAATHRWLDNGQHLVLGCCTRFRQWIDTLGLHDVLAVDRQLALPVASPRSRAVLGSVPWLGPLHLATGMVGYHHLSAHGRLTALGVGVRLAFAHPHPKQTFAQWLRSAGHREDEIARLWNLLGVSVFNAEADELSAAAAVQGFRLGFLGPPSHAALGMFRSPLGLIPERARAQLTRAGVDIRLRAGVARIVFDGPTARGVRLHSGEMLAADLTVATMQPPALRRLLMQDWPDHPFVQSLAAFRPNPILNLYLLFDRPVLDVPVLAAVDSPVQFVFNRGRLMGDPELSGRFLALSVSAADRWTAVPANTLVPTFVRALAHIAPGVGTANLLHARTVWQRDATMVLTPEAATLRPGPATDWPGLYLAGDWTDTGWPCSMESALRSVDNLTGSGLFS